MENFFHDIKALSHGAIFLATCNAILLLGTGHSLQGGGGELVAFHFPQHNFTWPCFSHCIK